jgi:hypothetical protein
MVTVVVIVDTIASIMVTDMVRVVGTVVMVEVDTLGTHMAEKEDGHWPIDAITSTN